MGCIKYNILFAIGDENYTSLNCLLFIIEKEKEVLNNINILFSVNFYSKPCQAETSRWKDPSKFHFGVIGSEE